MSRSIKLLVAAVLGCVVASTLCQSTQRAVGLRVGDWAPPLRVGAWSQGRAVDAFQEGHVYVVEFFSTTCGPCIAAMPQLSALQKQYPDVAVVGVDVKDEDSNVAPFLQRAGRRLTYRVALDDKREVNEGWMATHWLDAAGQRGVPATFVIDQHRRIAWIGHPSDLAPVLTRVVNRTFDIAATEAQRVQFEKELQRADDCKSAGDLTGVADALDAMSRLDQGMYANCADYERSRLFLETSLESVGVAAGRRYLAAANTETASIALHALALSIARAKTPSNAALTLADDLLDRALALRDYSQAMLWDTKAKIAMAGGDRAAAVRAQQRAVDAVDENDDRQAYQAALDFYRIGTPPLKN